MASRDTRSRQRGSGGHGAQAERGNDGARERVARAHDQSADIFERHAMLLDRFGAHRSANTEHRHAKDERQAAEAARQSPTPKQGSAYREVSN